MQAKKTAVCIKKKTLVQAQKDLCFQ